jgi:hypothetical protein
VDLVVLLGDESNEMGPRRHCDGASVSILEKSCVVGG